MGIITWIIVGALAGWIASMVMKTDEQMGALANIIVGIVGAIVGGWLLGTLFGFEPDNLVTTTLTAVVGAVVVLWLWRMFSGRRAAGPTDKV
jgi:uncharacterized membrane protein YeaQ/YmgE (transglycosylase-associated protein family)